MIKIPLIWSAQKTDTDGHNKDIFLTTGKLPHLSVYVTVKKKKNYVYNTSSKLLMWKEKKKKEDNRQPVNESNNEKQLI